MKEKQNVILIIRDGWGYRKSRKNNAINKKNAPFTFEFMQKYPNVLLAASGNAVGIPEGYQGNSEIGHLTIGSGRIILQSLERINRSIKESSFFKNRAIAGAVLNCKKNRSSLHIIGLLQTEGVHSHLNHLFAVLDLCKKMHFHNVLLHAITDGRDSPVTKSLKYIAMLENKLKAIGFGKIATVSGRYYAMDRDKRWDRTKKAYDCIVNAKADESFSNCMNMVKLCHKRKETDEFIVPKKAEWYKGVKPKDSFIFFNYRTDRPRQLTKAIVENDFEGWDRKPLNVYYVAMTQFYTPMNAHVAFPELKYKNLLGEVIGKHNLRQLRIAETEKYAHVTFFFNGHAEKPNKKEDRILVPSPKVATYDLMPEMSAFEITGKLKKAIDSGQYNLIVCNYANADMVGHTGIKKAIDSAVSVVDKCLNEVVIKGLEKGYCFLVLGDHGNAEDQRPGWETSHTLNPVPCLLISTEKQLQNAKLKKGMGLQDVAPTVLNIMGINKPKEMTGKSIILR